MAENSLHQLGPRFYSAVASVRGKLFMWDGWTKEFESPSKRKIAELASCVDSFEPQSKV